MNIYSRALDPAGSDPDPILEKKPDKTTRIWPSQPGSGHCKKKTRVRSFENNPDPDPTSYNSNLNFSLQYKNQYD